MSREIYTCRVTQIEAFRFWMYNANEQNESYINEANVIATIKGIESFNVKADYGSAGHSLIENAGAYRTDTGYQVKDFTFTDKQAQPVLKHAAEHPYWVREVALSKVYQLNDCDLIVTGTTDAIEGIQLRDTKFKFSSFDIADFYDSIQWRLYLHMVGLNIFWYDFFPVKHFNGMEDCAKAVIGEVESMAMYRYLEMETDIYTTLNEFMQFVMFKGLTSHLSLTPEKRRRILKGDSSLRKLITAA